MSSHNHNLRKAAYTVDEVAEILSLGRNLVFDLLNSGDLKRVRVGRRTIIPAESIISFLDKKCAEEAPANPYGSALHKMNEAKARREAARYAMEAA
jgi:excisionase family DNA binding protein